MSGIITRGRIMSKQLQKCLELSAHQGSHLFHAFAVDTKIAVARAGRRTKVNRLRGFIEEELHVIDEAKQQAGELVVENSSSSTSLLRDNVASTAFNASLASARDFLYGKGAMA
jgi:hypothetical protein